MSDLYALSTILMNYISYDELYSNAADHLTLQEALDIHYVLNPQFTNWYKYNSEVAQKLVRSHDLSHLVFGCDTGLLGEMRVQLWAKFAVQPFGWLDTLKYARDKESKVLLKNPVGYRRMLIFFIQNFAQVKLVKNQAAKMVKKWRYFEEDSYLAVPLGDIRSAYGIIL
jgi:hypothetical protein